MTANRQPVIGRSGGTTTRERQPLVVGRVFTSAGVVDERVVGRTLVGILRPPYRFEGTGYVAPTAFELQLAAHGVLAWQQLPGMLQGFRAEQDDRKPARQVVADLNTAALERLRPAALQDLALDPLDVNGDEQQAQLIKAAQEAVTASLEGALVSAQEYGTATEKAEIGRAWADEIIQLPASQELVAAIGCTMTQLRPWHH